MQGGLREVGKTRMPMEGAVESNGSPSCFYRYAVDVSGRDASKAHVRLSLWLRMRWPSSYYSFRIAHECKVNGVYAYADVKTTRAFWGHQWDGTFIVGYYDWGTFGWDASSPDYDGSVWHGPFTVFDADVPMATGDDAVSIVPCITQPPITGLGSYDEVFGPNDEDVTNWQGRTGYWRPFGDDEQVGSYAGRPCPEDGPWLNNRGLAELDCPKVGRYAAPSPVSRVDVSPRSIDVARQADTRIRASWPASRLASRYVVKVMDPNGPAEVTVTGTSAEVIPPSARNGLFEDGWDTCVTVTPVDANGVSGGATGSDAVRYFETPSRGPSSLRIECSRGIGAAGTRPEDAEAAYTPGTDGSYPVARYELLGPGGKVCSWPASAAAREGSERRYRPVRVAVGRPGASERYELVAYDSKGRELSPRASASVSMGSGVVSVWDGSAWLQGQPWVWDGSAWLQGERAWVWDGSAWRSI